MARTTKAQREASIQNIFADVGAEYGYESVSVRLTTRKYFSARWQKTYTWISFDLSDFVEYAPAEAIRGLAHSLLSRTKGDNIPYGQEFKDHVMSKRFLTQMQPRFIKRNRATANDELNSIVAGLDAPEGTVFMVTNSRSHTYITYSVLFRTVLVPMAILESMAADDVRDMIADKLTVLAHDIEHFGE
jgi:hypothetical protein